MAVPLGLITISFTVKEDIFVGEKFRTFPSKTFRMEFNFVLSNRPKMINTRSGNRKACKPGGIKFVIRTFFNYTKATKLNSIRKFHPLQYAKML